MTKDNNKNRGISLIGKLRLSKSRLLGSNPSTPASLSAVQETDPPHIFEKVRENYSSISLGHRTLFRTKPHQLIARKAVF